MRRWWGPERRALARRIAGYLRPYRRSVALAGACAVAESLLAIVPVAVLKSLVDRLAGSDPEFGPIVLLVAVSVLAAAAATAIGVAASYIVASLGEGIVTDLRDTLFDHLLSQGSSFYTRQRGGELLSRVLNDVSSVQYMLSETLMQLVRSGLTVVTTFGLLIVLDWRLAGMCMLLLPLVMLATRRAGRKMSRTSLRVQEQYAELSSYLQETLGLSGMLLVRSFGRRRLEQQRFSELNRELRRREIESAMSGRWFIAGLAMATTAGPALVLLAGGFLIINAGLSLGTVLVVATVVAGRLTSGIQGLASSIASGLASLSTWRRIFALLDTPSDLAEAEGARDLDDPRGAISLRDVTFTYAGQAEPALRDVSLDIAPGQLVAVVGPSGAGKTTLTTLISRLVDPTSGTVLLDGHDVRDLTFDALSGAISIVFQDTFLFNASLRENIRYGRPDATDAQLAEATRDAYLDPVITALPEGLDTLVGERGHRLSGGEKQRVALARAILKDPPVLVLDEATSHLDSASELLVQEGLEHLLPGRTSIVVAHRLSTVQRADLVVVLDAGLIVERGTHEELLRANGLYARLHGLQSGAPLPPRAG